MDIALRFFDDHVGDALYQNLKNPFATPASTSVLAPLEFGSSNVTTSFPFLVPSPITSILGRIPSLSSLPRDSVLRQCISLYILIYVGIFGLYFGVATFSYYFLFDRRLEHHPKFLKNQVRREIKYSLQAFYTIDFLTVPWFLGDIRGYSMLYDTIAQGPFGSNPVLAYLYMAFSAAFFIGFTDFTLYWIHRWLHIPFLYKRIHKPHHRWIIPTPFASHAFHPVDGYVQSIPYHLCCYIIPVHKYLFVALFVIVNMWTVFIHDSELLSHTWMNKYINGPAHHTLHHIYFTVNYGQYFTWQDKSGGSFRQPVEADDPLVAALANMERKAKLRADKEREKVIVEKTGLPVVLEEVASEMEDDEESLPPSCAGSPKV
ncbi:hypothetical protein T439DRAFT_326781 [Meredithblackwellia eburnea MCA 4105]